MEEITILVVDDEEEIRNLIAIYLQNEGYRVLKAADGVEALEMLRREEVQLLILDVMMPRMDGIQACLKIREQQHLPIIMLSAKSQDMDKIYGLSTGADDYMTKPFNPLELIARVKSQLRRYLKLNQVSALREDELEIGDLLINTATRGVKVSGRDVKLTPTEFAILELLARHPGVVFSTEHIYERVWKESFGQSDNTVMVHIRKLREKIEEDTRKPRYIKTVWGVGYKIENAF
ncbi:MULTISPECIES: response regulator transcription factor [Brevibacillus]|uniref:DNA-binding response regulator n=1 Tax=Brevibacillus borstelensis AK1 TaxID=1300222 RepID=M8D723_9BACL|nr:response regulator transcription factor [Brevibacillus borstelensis]EMT52044.1 DNA-binding response regulator [Brevibacillus borstelensis AK1]MBE5394039.1 response regulator transcription factor [Brevibacillus borstelensis]MCC0566993.1 response regulator transcription factor [Brevibacillus borstelensis]MCM3468929.1 response regulator transcription factor [Brevibacillus borstelensis]MCM3559684.1 response regulator transcription factor [Brevibacillus borstelensis]